MATEGLPVKLACRVLKISESGLLRKTLTAALSAIRSARMADRLDTSSPFRLARHLWHSTSSCRTDVGARTAPGDSRAARRFLRGRGRADVLSETPTRLACSGEVLGRGAGTGRGPLSKASFQKPELGGIASWLWLMSCT